LQVGGEGLPNPLPLPLPPVPLPMQQRCRISTIRSPRRRLRLPPLPSRPPLRPPPPPRLRTSSRGWETCMVRPRRRPRPCWVLVALPVAWAADLAGTAAWRAVRHTPLPVLALHRAASAVGQHTAMRQVRREVVASDLTAGLQATMAHRWRPLRRRRPSAAGSVMHLRPHRRTHRRLRRHPWRPPRSTPSVTWLRSSERRSPAASAAAAWAAAGRRSLPPRPLHHPRQTCLAASPHPHPHPHTRLHTRRPPCERPPPPPPPATTPSTCSDRDREEGGGGGGGWGEGLSDAQ
jgi:hypothetical protein